VQTKHKGLFVYCICYIKLDVELLYRAINAWRKEEEEFVKTNRWGAERKAALACLTEMEADLLLELERTKTRIKEKSREDNIQKQFRKVLCLQNSI